MTILSDLPRWSGFASQSNPWQLGYEWAHDRGDHHDLDIQEAIEASGWDLDAPEADAFESGASFAQNEIGGG